MNEQSVTLASAGETWAAALGTGGVFVLMIVIVWQVAATWRARMLASREEEYKRLTATYARLLEDHLEVQRRTAEELTQARVAIASMEKMMREID